jgi:hypothetical protein
MRLGRRFERSVVSYMSYYVCHVLHVILCLSYPKINSCCKNNTLKHDKAPAAGFGPLWRVWPPLAGLAPSGGFGPSAGFGPLCRVWLPLPGFAPSAGFGPLCRVWPPLPGLAPFCPVWLLQSRLQNENKSLSDFHHDIIPML